MNDLDLFFNVRTSHPVSNKFAGIVTLVRLVAGLFSSNLVRNHTSCDIKASGVSLSLENQ